MQVFDFTDGVQGKKLADIRIAHGLHGWLVNKDGSVYKVELANAPQGWAWHSGADHGFKPEDEITAEQFGVGAICFCIGEVYTMWHAGHPEAESEWQWTVIGTTDWNREACKKGILKSTFLRNEVN